MFYCYNSCFNDFKYGESAEPKNSVLRSVDCAEQLLMGKGHMFRQLPLQTCRFTCSSHPDVIKVTPPYWVACNNRSLDYTQHLPA
ncbi:hypothetical protein XELAEV_18034604mg [Xenopus laevis]|uniref:Uncharacterized protein n=1 Tax=Xenopus laevis TaxID=8355 RepID=A0A974HBP3_XENLA|nr:hypothetical protein XELAEV_18034604mg [Xenopus laevis]